MEPMSWPTAVVLIALIGAFGWIFYSIVRYTKPAETPLDKLAKLPQAQPPLFKSSTITFKAPTTEDAEKLAKIFATEAEKLASENAEDAELFASFSRYSHRPEKGSSYTVN